MSSILRFVRISCVLILLHPAWLVAEEFELAAGGQARSLIVKADAPANPLVIEYAAEELQRVVRKATGAELQAVSERELPAVASPPASLIFLGPCEATSRAGIRVDSLPENGFVIRSNSQQLHLCGKDAGTDHPRNYHVRMGTLFAVYEFLERQVGVRWLWPGELGEFVPVRERIMSGQWNLVHKPKLRQRYWRFEAALHYGREGWSSPARVYDYKVGVYKWLRRHRFMRTHTLDYGEAFRDYWQRFGASQPQLFNLLPDGTRQPDGMRTQHVSMCVSEPRLWKQIVSDWKETRTEKLPWINCKPNDTPGKCTCRRCLDWDVPRRDDSSALQAAKEAFAADEAHGWTWPERLGSLSDRYARFLLAVQEEARFTDEQATVISYAYANYSRPPLETRLNDRVVMALASSLFFPYTREASREFRSDWDGWRRTGARLILRPNVTFGSHNLPVHYARHIGGDIRHAMAHGAIATDLDSLTGMWATQGPSLYTIARMQRDANESTEEILEEYYEAFGPARQTVKAYFDYWEQVTERISRPVWEEMVHEFNIQNEVPLNFRTFYRVADRIYTPDVMARGRQLLQTASRQAAGDELATKRVEFLKKGLQDARMTLAVQKKFREYRAGGQRAPYDSALEQLLAFRKTLEGDYVLNLSYVTFQENQTWQHIR